MIFALKRPSQWTGPEDPVVVAYNEARTVGFHLRYDAAMRAFFGRRFKIYAECERIDGGWRLAKVVDDQPW